MYGAPVESISNSCEESGVDENKAALCDSVLPHIVVVKRNPMALYVLNFWGANVCMMLNPGGSTAYTSTHCSGVCMCRSAL